MKTKKIARATMFVVLFSIFVIFSLKEGMAQSTNISIGIYVGIGPLTPDSTNTAEFLRNIRSREDGPVGNPGSYAYWNPITNRDYVGIEEIIGTPDFGSWLGVAISDDKVEPPGNALYFRYHITSDTPFRISDVGYVADLTFRRYSGTLEDYYSEGKGIRADRPGIISSLESGVLYTEVFGVFLSMTVLAYPDNGTNAQDAINGIIRSYNYVSGTSTLTGSISLRGTTNSKEITVREKLVELRIGTVKLSGNRTLFWAYGLSNHEYWLEKSGDTKLWSNFLKMDNKGGHLTCVVTNNNFSRRFIRIAQH